MPELLVAAAVLAVIMVLPLLVKAASLAVVPMVAGVLLAASAVPFALRAVAKAKTPLDKALVTLACTPAIVALALAGTWLAFAFLGLIGR